MKNRQVLMVSLILLALNLSAIEFNTYDMEVEHVFSASFQGQNNINDLAVDLDSLGGEVSRGPSLFFIKNDLLVHDEAGKYRTILLDTEYSFKETYDYCIYNSKFYIFNDAYLGMNSYNGIKIVKNNEIISDISFTNLSFLRNNKDLYYQDNTLFILDKDSKLWGIKNPGLDNDENRKNIVKEEDIIKEINEGKYKGLTIDSKKRLFLNGELQTISSEVFINYWREKRDNKDKPKIEFTKSEDLYIQGNASYLGKDKDENRYWYQGSAFLIFNKYGWAIEDFLINDWKAVHCIPAVSPEGDVYFMKYGEDNVTLYKIPRKW